MVEVPQLLKEMMQMFRERLNRDFLADDISS